jgi:hypothetical protein
MNNQTEAVAQGQESGCLLKDSCLFKASGLYPTPGRIMSASEVQGLKRLLIFGGIGLLLLIAIPVFFMTYPFKTVVFTVPVEVCNPRKPFINRDGKKEMIPQVSVNGVVQMKIDYVKYIDNPGLVVRTLIRKRGEEIFVLDSSTVVTTRKAGKGITDSAFALNPNGFLVGTDTYVVFSIYYTLFGVRPIMVQFWSEKFDIAEVPGIPAVSCPPAQKW